jgi:hypothetical protein
MPHRTTCSVTNLSRLAVVSAFIDRFGDFWRVEEGLPNGNEGKIAQKNILSVSIHKIVAIMY